MTTEQFVFWLQGFFELSNPESINERQTKEIKRHLDLVFTKSQPKPAGVSETGQILGVQDNGKWVNLPPSNPFNKDLQCRNYIYGDFGPTENPTEGVIYKGTPISC